MAIQLTDLSTTQARLDMPFGSIELQRFQLPENIDSVLPASDDYRIDFSLTARTPNARMTFQDRWPAHRFETLGRVYLVPAGRMARARSSPGVQDAVICLLKRTKMDEWLHGQSARLDDRLEACLDIRNTSVDRLMAALGEEARSPGFASGALCEGISIQVAIEIARHHLAWDKALSSSALPRWQLEVIEDRLRAPCAPPTLTELAALCGISTRHLTRGFRSSRGCSVGTYIRNHQIEIAKCELMNCESIKMIAHRLGFSSRTSFSSAFQKATGLAPRQFRQREYAERSKRN